MGSTPNDWTLVGVMFDQIALLDPTVFEHDGRWWLLATIAGTMPDSDLHAWHASSPLGPWTSHPLNPVKSDVRAGRPAGNLFRVGDALYRPAQDCTKRYGDSISINRIVRLDPEGFEEVEVARVSPAAAWPWPDGLHTFNVFGHRIVIDARRQVTRVLPIFRCLRRSSRRVQR
jgi:hypothetical protein